ncbi:hypothetical protein [Fibrella arboris]|uniref:hypothetical protein n=1 Tax=Fibrella arboris TaxID=3242486 RepID=UPI0035202660
MQQAQKRHIIAYTGWILALSGLLFLNGCNKATDPQPADENELITTVTLRFTEQGTANTQAFTFQDKDGDGGAAPTRFDSVTLTAGKSYSLAVEVLDESKTPTDNITNEIKEKQDEHLFVYTANPGTLLAYTYGDKDSRNFPIGLTGTATTGPAGTGQFNVRLRHQPPVNGVAVKNGTSAPGSDDVNLTFSLTVK